MNHQAAHNQPANTAALRRGVQRYGFNGKEKDEENTEGVHDFGSRILETRLGRFHSTDNEHALYPSYSVYSFGFCDPISNVDVDGDKVNWWRFRSAWVIRKAMMETPKARAVWNEWRKTSARINLHTIDRVLTLQNTAPDGTVSYDIAEGLTVPRAAKLGRRTNSQGIRAYNNGRHFKRDRANNAKPFFSSVDVFISTGTKQLEDNAANLIGSDNFHTIPRAVQAQLIAQEIQTGNYSFCQVMQNTGPNGELNTPFGLINNVVVSVPNNANIGLNANGPGGIGVAAPIPNNNETNTEFLNRVSVHEGIHAINDPYESTNGSDPIRPGGTSNVWVAPSDQENVENDPCRNETETIRQQRP